MSNKLDYLVPHKILDQFYFGEVVEQMPVSLQSLATDLRVLRGDATEQHIHTLNGVYATNEYTYLPWLLDDIFDVPEEICLTIGQAWVLLMIAHVILDQSVDRDMPNLPTIPLVQQHLLLKASRIFGRQFEPPGAFWDQYYTCLSEFVEALAVESDYLDTRAQPYTYQIMQKVCAGKAAPFRLVAYAMALLNGKAQLLAVLNPAFDKLLLVDQLVDDALDWRKDYQAGRYTLPIFLALEAEGDSVETVCKPSANELSSRIERHGILVSMTKLAPPILEEVRLDLKKAGLEKTKLHTFFCKRIDIVQRYQRYYQAIALLGGLTRSLAKHTDRATTVTKL